MISDIEHIFMYLLAICMSYLEKYIKNVCSSPLCPSDCLCVVGFCLFCYSVVWVSYIFWILSLCQIYQFNSVAQLCLTLCDPMDYSMPGFPVIHQHHELAQTHVHQVGDAIQPSHPLWSPFPPDFNLSQHQCFSSESVLRIRWPEYWSFSFSISPFPHSIGCLFSC